MNHRTLTMTNLLNLTHTTHRAGRRRRTKRFRLLPARSLRPSVRLPARLPEQSRRFPSQPIDSDKDIAAATDYCSSVFVIFPSAEGKPRGGGGGAGHGYGRRLRALGEQLLQPLGDRFG